jgi:DNA-binding MarR family transcriptional regulator
LDCCTIIGTVTDSRELAEQLRAVIGKLVRTVRATDTMPPGEAAILGLLDRDGPQTAADLAQRRGVSHQSAAKSVQLLLNQRLLRAEPHPVDRRKRLLDLTPAGRERLRQERRRRADWLDAAIENALTPAEREELERCVELLARLTAHR